MRIHLRPGVPVQLYLLLAIQIVAALVLFASSLGGLYTVWRLQPEYSHGLLLPVLSAYLIWRQREDLKQLPFTGSWGGLGLIAAGLILRVIGQATTMATFEHYAFLLVIYGLVLALTGPAVFRRLWMPLLILVFAVPLPSFLNNPLSLQLQLVSSQLGVWVIRAAGISVLLEGNIIDLGSYQLEVAEACSGLRYLFPLMTLAFIVACGFRGEIWKRFVIFLSSMPITVVMNSLRIGFIGITVDRFGAQMAEGELHGFEGFFVFMLSTAALVLVAYALARLKGPVRLGDVFDLAPRAPIARNDASPAALPAQRLPRPFLAAAILVLCGAATGYTSLAPHVIVPVRAGFEEFPTRFGEWVGRREALEEIYRNRLQLDDYVLADYQEPDGVPVNFYVAYYQAQDLTRAVHSPNDCLPGGGWEIQRLEQRRFPAVGGAPAFPYNRAVIQLGSTRQIVYYWFQERGRRLTNDYFVRWYLFWDALTRHRTDGALVRFVAQLPPDASEPDVDARIMQLAMRIEPALSRFVPD
jgi:exosortase D (VPLPA-CTERM-specific)